MNSKAVVFRAGLKILYSTGLTSIFRGKLQGIGTIFCLHHVCPGGGLGTGFEPNSKLEITPEFLRSSIGLVRQRGYETVSLARLVEHLQRGEIPQNPLAVFTLDDAYRDNLLYAKPIFDELQCPYAIFAASSIADGSYTMWWRGVRVQHQLDRMRDLNSGGFLAHRSNTEIRDETKVRNTWNVGTGCERHPQGHTETVFG